MFHACAPESASEAVSAAAELWKAERSTVSFVKSADTQNGAKNTLVATLYDIDLSSDHTNDEVTSTSALTIMKKMTQRDRSEVDNIKVVIDQSTYEFETSYTIRQLQLADSLSLVAADFLTIAQQNDTAGMKRSVDNAFIPDSVLYKILPAIHEIDSIHGPMSEMTFTGFQYNEVKENKYPELIVWITGINGTTYGEYRFIFSTSTRQLVHIGINEEK